MSLCCSPTINLSQLDRLILQASNQHRLSSSISNLLQCSHNRFPNTSRTSPLHPPFTLPAEYSEAPRPPFPPLPLSSTALFPLPFFFPLFFLPSSTSSFSSSSLTNPISLLHLAQNPSTSLSAPLTPLQSPNRSKCLLVVGDVGRVGYHLWLGVPTSTLLS